MSEEVIPLSLEDHSDTRSQSPLTSSELKRRIKALEFNAQQEMLKSIEIAFNGWKKSLEKLLSDAGHNASRLKIVENYIKVTEEVIRAGKQHYKNVFVGCKENTPENRRKLHKDYDELKKAFNRFEREVMTLSKKEMIAVGIAFAFTVLLFILAVVSLLSMGSSLGTFAFVSALMASIGLAFCVAISAVYMGLSRTIGLDVAITPSTKPFFDRKKPTDPFCLDSVNTFFFGPGTTYRHSARTLLEETKVIKEASKQKFSELPRQQKDSGRQPETLTLIT